MSKEFKTASCSWAYENLKNATKTYGRKESVMFADVNNKVNNTQKILHITVQELGGFDYVCCEFPTPELFEKVFNMVWDNVESYSDPGRCIGRNERINGRPTKITNVFTGLHIMSNGISL